MTNSRETEIIVDKEIPAIRIIREFDAPVEKLFRAHVDPDLYAEWVGPNSLDGTKIDRWDCRSGGEYRFINVRGEEEYSFRGCFHDVVDNELITQTFTYEGMPEGVSLEKLTFEDLGDGRSRLTAVSLVDSFEARDAFVASGMEDGVREGYQKLDQLLATI